MAKKQKKQNNKATFSAQPYPLYAWGMWVTGVFNDDFTEIVDYDFNVDRLTIVGWMHEGSDVIPMVSSIACGIIPLYAFTGSPELTYTEYSDRWSDQMLDEFVLVEIAMAEPAPEVFEATKDYYGIVMRSGKPEFLPTVVYEGRNVG